MIFAASLGPFVKKALSDKGFQTNSSKIVELLSLNPAISKMDVVILGPKDMGGSKGRALKQALETRHPDVRIAYFYYKESEEGLVDGDILKLQVPKLTLEHVQEALHTVIEDRAISEDRRQLESADARDYRSENDHETTASKAGLSEQSASDFVDQALPEVSAGLEQRVIEIGKFADFDYLKKTLRQEHIQNELFSQNTEYAEVVNILEDMDTQIANIFKDVSIPPDMRFEKLKEIGINRSAYKGIENRLLVDKLAAVMESIVLSAEEAVDARIRQMREALDTITTKRLIYEDYGKLEELIDARMSVQMDLMELSKEIIEMYQAMDLSVHELIDRIQQNSPTHYAHVNELMEPIKPLFIPQNMHAITSRLLSDLNQNKVTFSVIEEKVRSVINLVFKLCEEDATIIAYQQKLIKLLQAQRVEDVVVVDHVIKNSLRIFVGPSDTGRTATALTWSGVASRRQNTLLLDLTGQSKLHQYGVEAIELGEFLNNRVERPFLCVSGSLDNPSEQVEEVVSELKARLNYYANIHVLLDASQTEVIDLLAASALSIHFITDCSPRGADLLKPAVAAFKEPNIAQKAILIDPPVDPIRIVNDVGLDPLLAKVIIVPRLNYIRACSLNRMKPYESKEVEEVFEEAFR